MRTSNVRRPLPEEHPEATEDVADAAFREVDDAAVHDDVRVRPVEAEQVREARHRDAEVRPSVAVPLLVQVDAGPTGDLHRRQEGGGLESRAVDEHVDLVFASVGRADASRCDLGDLLADQFDVVALERPRPDAVVAQHPLRPGWIGRGDRRKQVGPVGELDLQIRLEDHAAELVGLAHGGTIRLPVRVDPHVGEDTVTHLPEDREAVELAVGRHVAVQPAQTVGDRVVVVLGRSEPRRRPLEHHQLAGDRSDLRDELHCAGSGADDRDPLAGEVDVVVPTSRVERRSLERSDPVDVRVGRPVQLADRADDRVDVERLLALRFQPIARGPTSVHARRTTTPTAPPC